MNYFTLLAFNEHSSAFNEMSSAFVDHHDVAEADKLADEMHCILKEVCREILLETNFTKMLEDEKTKICRPQTKEAKFDGEVIMDEVLSRLDEKGFTFSCNYLKAKDVEKSTGTVGVCVLYSCYEKNVKKFVSLYVVKFTVPQ